MLSRIASAAGRNVRRAHTMSNDAYTKSPESFQKVLDTFKKYRACAVLRTPKEEQCAPAMQAAIDGGFEIVEVRIYIHSAEALRIEESLRGHTDPHKHTSNTCSHSSR